MRLAGPGVATAGGGGGGSGSGGAAALVGHWRNILSLIGAGGELIVSETRWRFDAGGTCSKTVLQTFVDRGEQFADTMLCTWTASATSIAITRDGSNVAATFSYRFDGADLLLDGFRFTRF